MSAEHQVRHLLCPSCDAEPPSDLATMTCPSCGARLVEVRSNDDTLIGTVIDGRFELRARLGEGGMGTVYRAWQRSIGREVAVKLIDQRFVRDVMAVRRFLREARLASQLSQPNTVSVFDVGQSDDGRLFIAMELIRGKNLDEVLTAEGAMTAQRAARIGVQMCDALQAAHALQIVHRDLKLANVMLLDDPPGRDLIKVLDFGLAKSLVDDESHKTQSGLVVGTPRYMAPELATGGTASPAADLYAIGVMLGELTTGKTLWEATTFTALIGQKLGGSAVIDDVPPPLRELVRRLIDPEPERRPASATAVRAILLEIAGEASGERGAPAPEEGAILARGGRTPAPIASAMTVPMRSPKSEPDSLAETSAQVSARVPAVPTAATVSAVTAPKRSRAPLYAIGGAAVFAIVVVIVLVSSGGSSSHDQPASAPKAPDAAASPRATVDAGAPPLAQAMVTLHVRSTPSGARIKLAGKPAGTTPNDLTVPLASAPLEIRLDLGGATITSTVVPDRDRDVDLTLPRKHAHGGGSTTPF